MIMSPIGIQANKKAFLHRGETLFYYQSIINLSNNIKFVILLLCRGSCLPRGRRCGHRLHRDMLYHLCTEVPV